MFWAELFDDLHESEIIGGCCHCNQEVYTVVPLPSGRTITQIRFQVDPANQRFDVRDMAVCEGSNGACSGPLVQVTFDGTNSRTFGVTFLNFFLLGSPTFYNLCIFLFG